MATIDIRLGGVSITDRVVYGRTNFTSVADGNPGSATVVIDNSDRGLTTADIDTGTALELYVDGTREWDGWVMGWSVGWPFEYDDTTVPLDAPVFWTLQGVDRNLLFQKRIMLNKADPPNNRGFKIWPADTPDKTAIEYSIDKYVDFSGDGLSYDIEQIDSPSPWEEFTLGYVSAPLGTLFEDCSEMTGGVYWVGPDRTLHYKSDKTVTAPFTLSDTPTGGQVGYRDLNAALDYTKAATEALVWGAGKGSDDPVYAKYTNDSAVSTYGLWQWGDFYAGAWKQQTVNRRARTYVTGSPTHRRGHDEPVPTVRCTVFTPGIRAGMVVLIVSTLFAYSEALPVRKVTMTFPTPSEVQYEIEASLNVDTPFGVPDPWWKNPATGDTPFREWFHVPSPTLPPELNPPSTASDNLIDHFDQDQFDQADVPGQTIASGTIDSHSWSVPIPSGLTNVDYLVMYLVLDNPETTAYTPNPTPNSGDWTYAHGQGTDQNTWVYYRRINGSETWGTSVDFDWEEVGTGNPLTGRGHWITMVVRAHVVDGVVLDGAPGDGSWDMQFPSFNWGLSQGSNKKTYYVFATRERATGITGDIVDSVTGDPDTSWTLLASDGSGTSGPTWYLWKFQTTSYVSASSRQVEDTALPASPSLDYYGYISGFMLYDNLLYPGSGTDSGVDFRDVTFIDESTANMDIPLPDIEAGDAIVIAIVMTHIGYNPSMDGWETGWDSYTSFPSSVNPRTYGYFHVHGVEEGDPLIGSGNSVNIAEKSGQTFTFERLYARAYKVPNARFDQVQEYGYAYNNSKLIWEVDDGDIDGAGGDSYIYPVDNNNYGDDPWTPTTPSWSLQVAWADVDFNDTGWHTYTWPSTYKTEDWAQQYKDSFTDSDNTGADVWLEAGLWFKLATKAQDFTEDWGHDANYAGSFFPIGNGGVWDVSDSGRQMILTLRLETAVGDSGQALPYLVTPGPEVTNAPWPGGNVYRSSASLSSSNDGTDLSAYVEESSLKGPFGPYFYLSDTHTDFATDEDAGIDFLQPSAWERSDPWSGFSTGWWSDGATHEGVDLVIKWRHVGDWGTANLRVDIRQHSIPLEGQGSGADGVVQPIDVWSSETSIELRGGNLSIYNGGTEFPRDWPVYGPDASGYSDTNLIYPFHAYYSTGEGPPIEKDTWYLTRIQFGQKPGGAGVDYRGYPYDATKSVALHGTGWNLTRVKSWKFDEPEPTSGDSDLFWWYWQYGSYSPPEVPPAHSDVQTWTTGGWDIAMGQAWNSNVDPGSVDWADGGWNYDSHWNYNAEYGNNLLSIGTAGDSGYEVDAIWALHGGIEQSVDDAFVFEGADTLLSDSQPYYDNTENTQNSVYITRYPYVPGTLKIWFEGVSLTRGVDFLEADPASGSFTLTGSRDQSGFLMVEYERSSTTESTGWVGTTGGEVYRPAPVLQYGWGSALDGYNCTMACGCMALDRHTLGANTTYTGSPRATPPIMRSYQNDQVGGSDLWDLATAWLNGWGQSLQLPSNYHTWSDFEGYINQGRGAVLAGTYGNLPSSKRFSSSFTGGHAIYINEQFSNGNFWGMDPLYRYPVIYTTAELQAYALGFVASGRVTAAFTQVT